MVPNWIAKVEGPLGLILVSVWRRLPDYMKGALNAQRIEAHVLPDDEYRAFIGHTRHVADVVMTGDGVVHLALNVALEKWPADVARAFCVHELSHVFLRHLDYGPISRAVPLPKVVEPYWQPLQDLAADYFLDRILGFGAELKVRRTWMRMLAQAHPEAW